MLYRVRDKRRERFCPPDSDPSFPIRFIEEVSSAPSRDELLWVIARWLSRMFPSHRASLTLQNDEENLAVVVFNGNDAIPRGSTLSIENTAAGQAFRHKEVWITSDTRSDAPDMADLQVLADNNLNSCISVPLIMSGHCFGCLNLAHRERGAYDDPDIPKLRALAFWIASKLDHYECVRIISDAMQRERNNQEKLDQLAKYDGLTGLLNRYQFTTELTERISQSPIGAEFSLLYLDLDGFKAVNDTFGHSAGDKLLKLTAQRITENVRSSDLVARLGGDEFAIAIAPMKKGARKLASDLSNRLVQAISRAFEFDGHMAFVSASIGARVASTHKPDLNAIFRDADLALYQVKRHGGSNIRFFDIAISEDVRREAELANDLRLAIERNQFEVHYQPIIDAKNHDIVSCEALARWRHPHHGFIPPPRFISMAESSSYIAALGDWVLRTACIEAAAWPSHVSISVNVSPRQFLIGDFVSQVSHALRDSGLRPERLQLEITETVILNECKETAGALERLLDMGVRVVLDDFGTGYASFNYLKQFRFKKLKIDKSLIDTLGEDDKTLAIIEAVVKVADALTISTTAEGVETEKQWHHLCELGCNELQGHLFSKPLPSRDVRQLLLSSDARTDLSTQTAHSQRMFSPVQGPAP